MTCNLKNKLKKINLMFTVRVPHLRHFHPLWVSTNTLLKVFALSPYYKIHTSCNWTADFKLRILYKGSQPLDHLQFKNC